MSEQIIAYKMINSSDNPFDYVPTARLGDVVVMTFDRTENVPCGWTILPASLLNFRLGPFDKTVPFPALIGLSPIFYSTPKRIELASGQHWRPTIECRTFAPKIILSIKPNEIEYRWGGEHVWCEPKSFFEWIIYTKANLIEGLV